MAVGPHQHEATLVKRGNLLIGEIDNGERHAPRLGGGGDAGAGGWRGAEAQQHEARAEEIEDRAAVVSSQACGARVPGRADGTNCLVSTGIAGLPSPTTIGDGS